MKGQALGILFLFFILFSVKLDWFLRNSFICFNLFTKFNFIFNFAIVTAQPVL